MTDHWHMKTILTVLAIVGLLFLMSSLDLSDNSARGKYYDCSMAEWHPDFPVKVKEACRAKRK